MHRGSAKAKGGDGGRFLAGRENTRDQNDRDSRNESLSHGIRVGKKLTMQSEHGSEGEEREANKKREGKEAREREKRI